MIKQAIKYSLYLAILALFLACSQKQPADLNLTQADSKEIQEAPYSPSQADWPHSISDMAPDPRVKFGRLENGMRYAILPVEDNKGIVSIQMHVSTGFRDEPEHLYGIAHILEHMVFRGANTDNKSTIIHDMQSLGAGFGFDLNGFTANDNTFYRVNLSSPKFDNISTALESFSKLVMEPNLTKEYLDIERKVVLSELKQRDTISARASLDRQQFQYPDRDRNKVPGIGTQKSLDAITLEDVEAFFQTHYRPDNTVLFIAGGVNLSKTENKITQLFSRWLKNSKTTPYENERNIEVDLSTFLKVKHYAEAGAKTQLNLIENTPSTLQNDTLKKRETYFAERMVNAMIKRRLKPRMEDEEQVSWINLRKARTHNYDIRSVAIGAKDYVIATKFFEEERRRAIQFGFTEEELALSLKSELAVLTHQNEQPEFINAWSEANRLRTHYNSGSVYLNPAQKLVQFQLFSEALSLQDYHEVAKTLWSDFNPRYWTQSSKGMEDTLIKIHANLEKVAEAEISKPVDFTPDVFKNTNFGQGRVVSRDIYSKDNIDRLLFANGARLNYLERKNEKDDIQIAVTLTGDFTEFAPRYASVVEQASAFSRADIHGVTKSEMDRQFVGQKTHFSVQVSGKSLLISASTQGDDLEAILNLITAFIVNADVNSKQHKQRFDQNIKNVKTASNNSPAVTGALKIPYIYSGKSSSFLSKTGGLYSSDEKTLKSIKSILDTGLIEVGVVGDFDPKILEDLFSSSLGAITPSRNKVDWSTEKLDSVTHIKPGVTNLTYDGTAKQMAVLYCWPVKSEENIKNEVLVDLGSQVINNRIIQRFREEQGLTYSPSIVRQQNPAFPDFKYTCFSVQFSPEDETIVHENFRNILEEISTKPITKIELTRAREPIISLLSRYGDSNHTLALVTAFAHSDPSLLKKQKEIVPLLNKTRLKTLNRHVYQNYLIEDAHIFRVHSPEPYLEVKRKNLQIEAQIGRAQAQYALGDLLKNRAEDGDEVKALSLFEKAAAQNYKEAHFSLGRHYALAREDLEKAANHLKLSDESKEGAFLLAEIYFRNPQKFTDITEEQIMNLYRLSAENGYSYGQQALAQRYKDGSITKRDLTKAFQWALISRSDSRGVTQNIDTNYFMRFKESLSKQEQIKALKDADDWIKNFKEDDF